MLLTVLPALRLLRRLLAVLNSELTPTQVGLGFAFGVLAGFVPWGANTLLWLTLAFLLNVSFSATLLAFALFRGAGWLLLPASYDLGRALLEPGAWEPLWSALAHAPVLAWLELDRYAVLGSYALALPAAGLAFFGIRAFVRTYREVFFARLERTRPWRALSRRQRLFRWIPWLLLGGGVRFRGPRRRGVFRFVRRPALVALPLAYGAAYGAAAWLAPLLVGEVVARGATLVVGGEVAVEQTRVNALTGRLWLEGLTVQDPNRPEEDVIRVREITADLSLWGLTRRRVVLDEVVLGEVFLGVRREADGSLNLDDLPEGPDWQPYFEWLRERAGKVDWVQLLERYGETLWERFVKLLEPKPPPPNAPLLLDYKPLPAPFPTFAVKRLRVERLHLRLVDEFRGDGELPPVTAVDVVVENFAWRPERGRGPITLGIKAYFGDPGTGVGAGAEGSFVSFTAVFDERARPPKRRYELRAERIDLAAIRPLWERSLPLRPAQGVASLSAQIAQEGDRLEGEAALVLVGARLEGPPEGLPLFGFDAATSQRILEGLNAYAQRCPLVLGVRVAGAKGRYEWRWDASLLRAAKRGLVWLGTLPFAPILARLDARLREWAPVLPEREELPPALRDLLTALPLGAPPGAAGCDDPSGRPPR